MTKLDRRTKESPKRLRSNSVPVKPRVDLKPSEALMTAWKPIEAACVAGILGTTANTDNGGDRAFVAINFGDSFSDIPDGFPYNSHNEDGGRVRLRAETILLWMYVQRLTEYTPAILFRRRRSLLNKTMEISKILDIDLEDMVE